MSKTLATVFSVELNVPTVKKDGGTYSAAKISYQEKGVDGSVGNIKTNTTNMIFLAKNPGLQNKIFGLANGELPANVVLVQEKQGNFTNLTDILTVEETNPSELTASVGTSGNYSQGGGSSSPQKSAKFFNNPRKESDDKSASINRAVALKAAVEFMATTETTPSKVIGVAKEFEAYLKGE